MELQSLFKVLFARFWVTRPWVRKFNIHFSFERSRDPDGRHVSCECLRWFFFDLLRWILNNLWLWFRYNQLFILVLCNRWLSLNYLCGWSLEHLYGDDLCNICIIFRAFGSLSFINTKVLAPWCLYYFSLRFFQFFRGVHMWWRLLNFWGVLSYVGKVIVLLARLPGESWVGYLNVC